MKTPVKFQKNLSNKTFDTEDTKNVKECCRTMTSLVSPELVKSENEHVRNGLTPNLCMNLKCVIRSNLCSNCLAGGYIDVICPPLDQCHVCGRKHHTMLHINLIICRIFCSNMLKFVLVSACLC